MLSLPTKNGFFAFRTHAAPTISNQQKTCTIAENAMYGEKMKSDSAFRRKNLESRGNRTQTDLLWALIDIKKII